MAKHFFVYIFFVKSNDYHLFLLTLHQNYQTMKNKDEKFMRMAIDLAVENVANGGGPFGAVIVKDGEVFFSSVKLIAKLEGKTLTLTQLAAPKAEGAFIYMEEDGAYHKSDDPCVTEVPYKSVLVLERK